MGYLRDNLNSIFGIHGTNSRDVMVKTLDNLAPFGKPNVIDHDIQYEPCGNSVHSDLGDICKRLSHRRRY